MKIDVQGKLKTQHEIPFSTKFGVKRSFKPYYMPMFFFGIFWF